MKISHQAARLGSTCNWTCPPKAINAVLAILGQPSTDRHSKAFEAETVKGLASANLTDRYRKAVGYLGEVLKLTQNTNTIWQSQPEPPLTSHGKRH